MAFNGAPKAAVKTNKQDYMNLLYSDSDSDHVPDLKLPPVKGKKQRRKKLTNMTKEDAGCDALCVFKTMLVLLVCATLVILAGLNIWTLQRVSDLQKQVRESPSKSSKLENPYILLQSKENLEGSSMAIVKEAVVEYKVPKRMKKRKQLDALVDMTKLPRNRKGSTSQELLDFKSDSSDVEEFSVNGLSTRKANGCCICHGIVIRIGLFMVSMACLSICLGLVWVQWHLRHEINALQEKLLTVQSSDSSQTDLSVLQKEVKDINEIVSELKKKDGVLENLKSTVDELSAKVKRVEGVASKLNESVVSAQQLINTPKKLEDLTHVVAKQGNDQLSLKTSIDGLAETISHLQEQQKESTVDVKEKKNSLDTQFGDMLSQQIARVNETATSGILSVKEQLDLVNEKLSKEPTLNNEKVENLVATLIQEKLNNLTVSSGSGLGEETGKENLSAISELSQRINNLSLILDFKSDFADTMGLISKGDFVLFKDVTLMNLESINRTVFALSAEFESVLHRLDTLDAVILNISAAVTNNSMEVIDEPEPFPDSSHTDAVSTTVETPWTEQSFDPVASNPSLQGTENYGNAKPEFHIEGINTVEDLHEAYPNWPLKNGQLEEDALLSLLKSNSTAALEKFDTNSDGRFDEEELQKVLGLPPSPRRCKSSSVFCTFFYLPELEQNGEMYSSA
ncbi:EF-hand calcium-binding domain-containing protein 14 [Plakobranchus ocellatus]|uniref:EF-hand calcium-binding domain-containing protein 14 n=1 Tax=Plakobranchus ocellatus TaxID=259542 RepID=A0AAV4B3E4_9GAST|nr:EF-hand calcium-binding domain-containing protein 14 [Plakobranchus ocellatus]